MCVYVVSRGRYTLQVSPLLIHAQKRLLERVTDFNGPPVPQPHHVRTQRYTETPVLTHYQSAYYKGYDDDCGYVMIRDALLCQL